MNKAFEKILKKIEEKRNKYQRLADSSNFDGWNEEDIKYSAKAEMCEELKEIVQEVAEEYNGGWIPCSEMLPEPNQKVIVSYMDRYIGGSYGVCEGQYVYILNSWDISDYMSDDDFEVIAWQPLPEPFKERD